ncbi:hypothetical protein SAMN05661093_10885 [Kibdelosporangium aridum]|uniref:VOC domain-containing protein n=2 Tax=Kibdelosporangium aridum TaxID=2030 RepID=A0A1Y5YD78_KIBAR|nr:hypothetical protein SAMN05661093_10885 [Kibdelosporangium aridum]
MFTKIVVEDLDAQSAFYANVLGLEPKHRFSGGAGDAAFEEIVMGDGPSLLLLHYPHREPPRRGGTVLGFAVADVDQVVRAAEHAGGAVRSEPKTLAQPAIRVAELADPEGHLLEIIQHMGEETDV